METSDIKGLAMTAAAFGAKAVPAVAGGVLALGRSLLFGQLGSAIAKGIDQGMGAAIGCCATSAGTHLPEAREPSSTDLVLTFDGLMSKADAEHYGYPYEFEGKHYG